jgi:uncharacterized protein (UPF0276 family)
MNTHQAPRSTLGLGVTGFAQLPALLARGPIQPDFIELDVQASALDSAATTAATAAATLPTAGHVLRASLLPVAGTAEFGVLQSQALVQAVQGFEPLWVSAPLGFTHATASTADGKGFYAGVALPPLQCPATVLLAVRRIEQLRRLGGRPVAFHIVPNYLKPQAGEMPDGEFYAAVADAAGCGIDLDLHTLLRHERYGRAHVREVMARLPLQRVWQLRVGTGTLAQVADLLAEWLPALPQLSSLVLDVTPTRMMGAAGSAGAAGAVPDAATLARQLHTLQGLWATRGTAAVARSRKPRPATDALPYSEGPACTVEDWERALACLANHRFPSRENRPPAGLLIDPGLALHRQQNNAERSAVLALHLPLSWRVLGDSLGPVAMQALLHEFWRLHGPEPLAQDEVRHFTACLRRALAKGRLPIPHLRNVLHLDTASLEQHSSETQIHFDGEPLLALAAMGRGGVPSSRAAG